MTTLGSVSFWLDRLKAGEARDEAVAQLWRRYFTQLVRQAEHRLKGKRSLSDGEDVALFAFAAFVKSAEAGRFPKLEDRNDLWSILLMLTANKAKNAIRDEHRRIRTEAMTLEPSESPASSEPTPDEVLALAEGLEQLLGKLSSDEQRQIAIHRMDGHTNAEIAAKLGRAIATIERKLKLIRERWIHKQDRY